MDQPLSESRFAQFSFGFYLVTPYMLQLVLTALVLVFGILLLGPGIFLAKYAFCLSLAACGFQLLLAGAMVVQSISRTASRTVMSRPPREEAFFMSPVGSDIAVISFAVVAIVGCLLFAINITAALCGCPTRNTNEALADFIFNTTNSSTVTDWNELERLPYFWTELAWYQLCLDDYAFTIAWAVLAYATVVLDCIVIYHQGRLRDLTETLYGTIKRGAPQEAEPNTALPVAEQGIEAVDVLVSRLTQRRFITRL